MNIILISSFSAFSKISTGGGEPKSIKESSISAIKSTGGGGYSEPISAIKSTGGGGYSGSVSTSSIKTTTATSISSTGGGLIF